MTRRSGDISRKEYPTPNSDEIVSGFDEWKKVRIKVMYRADINRFWSGGSVWPLSRLHNWNSIKEKN